MKKIFAFAVAMAILLMSTSCGGPIGEEASDTSTNESAGTTTADTTPSETTVGEVPPPVVTSLDLLNRIWNSYPEDERFFAAGGDYSEAHATDGAPGIFDIDGEIGATMDSRLGFPDASRSMLRDAASLQFLMNANTFTSGAYHLNQDADILDIAVKIRDNLQNRNWVCGIPERLTVFSIGGFMVSAFGHNDFIEPFKTHLFEAFPDAVVCFDEAISFGEE